MLTCDIGKSQMLHLEGTLRYTGMGKSSFTAIHMENNTMVNK